MELKFPHGFFWGAATSSHQVEGGNFNDWTQWEKENSEGLAKAAALKKWPQYILDRYPNPLQPENYISGRACDHYNLYEKDFEIANELGHNAHRFSLEWSRIEPEEGKFNEEAIEHYRKVLQALKSRGLEPFVTLWHWTNPVWIQKIGGWENPKTIEYFLRFARRVFEEYGQSVKFWIPFNEPGTAISYGYIYGTQPPGVRSKKRANLVFANLMEAHKKIFLLNKNEKFGFQIGCSHFIFYRKAHKNLPWNFLAKKIMDHFADARFLKVFKDYSDFFGIQYYQPESVNVKLGGRIMGLVEKKTTMQWLNDLGWGVFPEGIYHVLKQLAKFGKPIYITENGLADARDESRGKFIREHLRWLHKAISEGIDVRGYFHWSLLDNFEFVDMRGYWPRFGLIEVDYKTLGRSIRPSAWEYAKICKNNSLEID
ncbi:MAG: glycoside hydrolase family 1 protein [Candidatus Portnoybacteria bacterium]|nr:glycoside hydrolase family 1 protein [Candidatus Portnoybacteria bacterium]